MNRSSPNVDSRVIEAIRRHAYRILVIDDDDSFRKSFRFMLERIFNAQVEDVSSGAAGIEKVRSCSYDLIFTDIMMPEMTGVEAYQELIKVDAGARIVMMSAYSNSSEWEKAQGLTGATVLQKPIPSNALIEVLSRKDEG